MIHLHTNRDLLKNQYRLHGDTRKKFIEAQYFLMHVAVIRRPARVF